MKKKREKQNKEALWFNFLRGRQDFKAGRPRPSTPKDGEDMSPEALRWYGWMTERVLTMMARKRVRSLMEGSE